MSYSFKIIIVFTTYILKYFLIYLGIYGGNQLMYILRGHKSGVTHLQFSPDGLKLYSGSRKGDNDIVCWDLRNVGEILYSVERIVTTNQRIYFDISSDGKYLVSGLTSLFKIQFNDTAY